MYSEWLAYGSDAKRIATAYASGVNAYIKLTGENPDLMPWEFKFLDYEPALWSAEDTVRIRSHGLIRNVRNEVRRALFVRDHGLEADAIRYPLSPEWKTTVPEGLDLDALLPLEPYDPAQMHADFRATFLANEVTVRVLHQILAWGHVGKTATAGPSPTSVHFSFSVVTSHDAFTVAVLPATATAYVAGEKT